MSPDTVDAVGRLFRPSSAGLAFDTYRAEMLTSYRAAPAQWWEVLLCAVEPVPARPLTRILVVSCRCRAAVCHRGALAGFLAKLGAFDGGELPSWAQRGLSLDDVRGCHVA